MSEREFVVTGGYAVHTLDCHVVRRGLEARCLCEYMGQPCGDPECQYEAPFRRITRADAERYLDHRGRTRCTFCVPDVREPARPPAPPVYYRSGLGWPA